jgi:hypothetical protein
MQFMLESKTPNAGKSYIGYFPGELKSLAGIETYIVSTEEGFSPLGSNIRYLEAELNVPAEEIKRLADWNRFKNTEVSLVAIASRVPSSQLRGVILSAAEGSKCYERYAMPIYGKPYRDFYYNVTYEALAYAKSHWGARSFAISHLSHSCNFHPDIATCNAEAFLHFAEALNDGAASLTFLRDCDIELEDLSGAEKLLKSCVLGRVGEHRQIVTSIRSFEGATVIDLAIPSPKQWLPQ